MAQVVERVRRVRSAVEPNAAFATEISIGSFSDVIMREDSFKLTLDAPQESPMINQQHIHGYPTKVSLPKSATADVTINLTSQALASAPYNANLWTAAFGTSTGGASTTIANTGSVTTIIVTSATGFLEGGAVMCATGPGGSYEAREIKTISGVNITVKLAFSSNPPVSLPVYAAATYYFANTDGSIIKFLQLAVEGLGLGDRWLARGGALKGPPTFALEPGTVPKVTFPFQFADWDLANGTNTTMNLTSSAIADQSYASTGMNVVMDSEFRIATVGTSTLAGTLVDAPSITIAPQLKNVPHKTPAGINTIKQWVPVRNDGPPVTGEFQIPYEGTTWMDFRDAKTARAVFYQIGTSSAGAVLISCPNVIFDDFQRTDLTGIAGQTIKFYGKLDNSTTTNTTDLQKSPFRIHFF
jgi:hypothetical protein